MVGMLLHESWTYLEFVLLIVISFIHMASFWILINQISTIFVCACFYSYTEEMAPISDEIEVKDEPWINSSEYDQVGYGIQVSRFLFYSYRIMLSYLSKFDVFFPSYLNAHTYVCIYISASHFFSSTMIKMAATLQRVGR